MRYTLSLVALLSGMALLCGCGGSNDTNSPGPGGVKPADRITGSGSSFVAPLMKKWAGSYNKATQLEVDYTSKGSSTGIAEMIDQKNDFGGTDAPMNEEQLKKAHEKNGEVINIPLTMGPVAPFYNLPEIEKPLNFTGPILADIYLGKIKKWNDPALQKINPGVKLPDKEIVVVHRRDGSGTTDIWTDYLSKMSPEWQKGPGRGLEVKWPVGQTESGNAGVAEFVRKNPGSIGYVELSYAHREGLDLGLVQNREGEFVKARLQSITAAADSALTHIPDDLRYSLTDAPGKASYPVSGTTWALVYARQPAGKGRQLVDFLGWVLGEGQEDAEQLLYARLPEGLAARAHAKLEQIQVGQ